METIENREYTAYPDEADSDNLYQWEKSTDHRSISKKRMLELPKYETHYMHDDRNNCEYMRNRVYGIDETEICRIPVWSSYDIVIEYGYG